MAYRECPTPPSLRALVECGWQARVASEQRVLPDGCMDLYWDGTTVLIAGPDSTVFLPDQTPGSVITGIRFHPGIAPALLGVPAAALRDLRIPLGELHRDAACRASGLIESGRPPLHALLGTVTGLRTSAPLPDPALGLIAAQLGAGAAVEAVADRLGWTTRSLHRRSRAAFGYGPATFRRILRFRRAIGLALTGIPAAEVAARTGYADQPHLSREVRALAGVPLGQLLAGAKRSTPLPSGSCTTA